MAHGHLHRAAAERLVVIDRGEVRVEERHVERGVRRGEREACSAAVLRLPARVAGVLKHAGLGARSLVQEESIPGACVCVRGAWCVVRGAWCAFAEACVCMLMRVWTTLRLRPRLRPRLGLRLGARLEARLG